MKGHPEFLPPDGEPVTLFLQDIPSTLESIVHFDGAHELVLDACAEYAFDSTAENFTRTCEASTRAAATFSSVLDTLARADLPSDEYVSMVSGLILEKDADLCKHMALLTDCNGFVGITEMPDEVERFKTKINKKFSKSATPQKFSMKMLDVYMEMFADELSHFAKDLQCKREGRPLHPEDEDEADEIIPFEDPTAAEVPRRGSIAAAAGKWALSASAVAAGVTIGIEASRLLEYIGR